MEMLGAITGLIGAGLQAQAQADQLQFQYAHFNWEKQRANTQDRFAQASRSDQYGNVTGYDPILNKWDVKLAPTQKEISDAGQKEQLLQLTKDIPAARKIKEAVQQRAYDAKEPFLRASLGYQYDQPPSEDSIRSKLTELMASNEMIKSKADQALLMRQAARMGHGAKAADIINANDLALGNEQRVKDRMLQARTDAMKEFAARTSLHEQMWGKPMEMWGSLMAQGGDLPAIPKSSATDSTGAQQQAMLSAFNQGTQNVGKAFDSLASAAGKSPDLSSVAKLLAGIGKGGGKGGGASTSPSEENSTPFGGSGSGSSVFDTGTTPWATWNQADPSRSDWGIGGGGGGFDW